MADSADTSKEPGMTPTEESPMEVDVRQSEEAMDTESGAKESALAAAGSEALDAINNIPGVQVFRPGSMTEEETEVIIYNVILST